MIDKKFILARNYIQYRYFIVRNELDRKEYNYVSQPSDFAGVHNLILVEGYEGNPVYMQMYDFINFMCDCEYVGLDEAYPKTREKIIYA